MELYILNNNFLREHVIDNFVSLIWTERYTSAGDVQLTLVPTKFYIDSLKPGTYLSIPESQDIMIIETQLIENGLLKISGRDLLTILNQRNVWQIDTTSTAFQPPPKEYVRTDFVPGHFIMDVINVFGINVPNTPHWNANLNAVGEKFLTYHWAQLIIQAQQQNLLLHWALYIML